MRITQKEISRRLGVSLITVSRALNDTGYVSRELKERILQFAKSNSYVPHRASQVLVRNKTHRVAMFSSSLPAYFWDDIRKGVIVAAEQIRPFDYEVRYHTIAESDSRAYLRTLRREIKEGAEAFAFVYQRIYDMDSILDLVDHAGIPYVTFNVDAPEGNRLCYIGSDYQAGGRLSAEFIGKTVAFKQDASVLVITENERADRYADKPNINSERLTGFLAVMQKRFPTVACHVEHITTPLQAERADTQIPDILRKRRGSVDAVYLIPAFNSVFLEALEALRYRSTVTVLHDLDNSAMHHLETHLLSAVIYQNPILQGYYTVKTLEHLLESNRRDRMEGIEIVSNLILAENRNLHRNHYALIT